MLVAQIIGIRYAPCYAATAALTRQIVMNETMIKLTLVSVAIIILAGCAGQSPAPSAERLSVDATLVFLNGQIYTANPQQQMMNAMIVEGDEITAMGNNADMLALAGNASQQIDLAGALVLPGLIDAHLHPAEIIRYDDCNLHSEPMNLRQMADFIEACVARMTIPAGQWLAVRQWNFSENNLPASGLQSLRQALDAAAPQTLVVLFGNDGHHQATNSLGLAAARDTEGNQVGLTADTLANQFKGNEAFVGVDLNGEPNGAVNEGAFRLLGAPSILQASMPILVREVGQMPKRLNSLGITSIMDAAAVPGLNNLYDALLAEGDMSVRISLAQYLLPENYIDSKGQLDMTALLVDAAATRDRYAGSKTIRANTLKFFVDGVLEGDPLANPPTLPNGAMLAPYKQPHFEFDPQIGQVQLMGYIDTGSVVCKQWRASTMHDIQASQAFTRINGFHPGQCTISNGVLFSPETVANDFTQRADAAGFKVHMHAIGDRAVRVGIDAIEAVTPHGATLNKHSMAHLQLVSSDDIVRLGSLKIPVAFTYAWAVKNPPYDMTVVPFIEDLASADAMYDPASYYYQHFYPAKSIKAAGGILAAGSDAPVDTDDPRPFVNIEVAVTRDDGGGSYNAAEGLSILDAIDAYTINGARLLGEQAEIGSLAPGKKADFVIMADNIVELARTGAANQIHAARVLQTWFDGRLVYALDESE